MSRMKELLDSYEKHRKNPYPNLWSSISNWLSRIWGSKRAFLSIRDHDINNANHAQRKVKEIIRRNEIQVEELKDIVVFLKIHISRLNHRSQFLVHLAILFAAFISVNKIDSVNFIVSTVGFGMLSILMIAERTYLFKYKILYEELKDLLDREIEWMENPNKRLQLDNL